MTIFNKTRPKPELLIFARMFVVGILGAEVFQVTYHIAKAFASILIDVGLWPKLVPAALISAFCILYAVNRGIVTDFKKHIKRIRFDLFAYIGLGIWANFFGAQFLDEFHQNLTKCDPWLAPFLMIALLIPLFSNWFLHGSTTKNTLAQFSFLSDEEIKTSGEDLLEHKDLAKNFAEVVLQSSSDSRLVFGIDGPWGSGKTTFINFAEEHWKKEQDVVVCRFEPLRYASDSESDLSQRLIREITDTIQEHFFVPELHSIASRYSRLLKGDPTITYHGLKLSLEQRGETLDELLESINSVLDAYGIRLIIVIDDLDRLDPKAVNNVLFVTRRAFNLKRTTYILCYDTEILISGKEDGQRAREFLEKFVTVKQNLFVDPKQLIQFLRHDWSEGVPGEIPADLLHKASPFLNELADALSEGEGAEYLGLIGDMRKIKRFVNAFTLLQLEKTDFARTDFHKRDLVNLILIHLHYPSLFRDIYTKETNEQSGTYSLSRKFGDRTFKNSEEFDDSAKTHPKSAEFLLRQLFDEKKIRRRTGDNFDELELRTRACFNHEPHRNLESYLLLIGKIIRPEPRKTFILYKNAVQRILEKETSIKTELESHDLALSHGTHAHSEFWRLLANQSHKFDIENAEEAFNSLIAQLPKYPIIPGHDLRHKSIYYLLLLLEHAGWGGTFEQRRNNTSSNITEIARRIYGEREHENKGLIRRIAASDRGALGWYDLMLFRLQCSADIRGQLFNINRALIVNENPETRTDGLTTELARQGMRRISQEIFKHFKNSYIDSGRNFAAEVHNISNKEFLGTDEIATFITHEQNQKSTPLTDLVAATRSRIFVFVIYQLSNPYPPTGSGVGCGYYDESGTDDGNGIATSMNKYLFGTCFNPTTDETNILYFLDYCLCKLSNPLLSDGDDEKYFAKKEELCNGLDEGAIGEFWMEHQNKIRSIAKKHDDRLVTTSDYKVTYSEYLPKVFKALDDLTANE